MKAVKSDSVAKVCYYTEIEELEKAITEEAGNEETVKAKFEKLDITFNVGVSSRERAL
ncbi:MAG: hypothetical protein IH840_10465, partial [Candidatus Heimdallarchaeota archaeon]|nr:hypothetical protein [Candidatus Heimdallarchaeota archaeon]